MSRNNLFPPDHGSSTPGAASAHQRTLAIAGLLLTAAFAGCALIRPDPLAGVRQRMAAGQYLTARQELLALEARPEALGPGQLREAKDDLCVCEYMIGEPTYSRSEQRRVCAAAAQEPGSKSGQLLTTINESIRTTASDKVAAALAKGDLADAEQAALAYLETPGADPRVVADWSHRMWALVREQDQRAEPQRKPKIGAAIAEVRKNNRALKSMHKNEFLEWIARQGAAGGTRIFSSVSLKDDEVHLKVPAASVQDAALNLDRFAAINDGMVARCGCDGRTDAAIAETNFPLYLVRLDPETKRSEVLILPHR